MTERELLATAVNIVDILLGQQAMPDPGLDAVIERWKLAVRLAIEGGSQ